MKASRIPAFALLALLLASPARTQDDLAAAKDLYASAKYEEALALLDRLKETKPSAPSVALGVEQYRAICLLALNRKADADQAIEAVADLDPFYQPAEDDAAPWVRNAFREGRRRVLPAALQRLYGRAKSAYDQKAAGDAVEGFKRVLALLDDPDLTLDKGAVADMRMVAQGFLDLSRAAASAALPPPAVPAVQEKPSQPEAPAERAGPVIYDAAASDVTPPLPLNQLIPAWPTAVRPPAGTTCVVEIVVGETGRVESAVIRASAGGFYDQLITQAALGWNYRPATKGGKPVKYRRMVRVVLTPSAPPSEPREA